MAKDTTFYKSRPSFTVRDIGTPVMIEFTDTARGKMIATFVGFRLLPAQGADAAMGTHERTEITLERVINGATETTILRLSEIAAVYPPRTKKARAPRVDANGNPVARVNKRSVPLTALDDAAAAAIFTAFDQMVAAEHMTADDFETTPTTDDDGDAGDDDRIGMYANTGEKWNEAPATETEEESAEEFGRQFADDDAYQGEPGENIEAQVATPKAKKTSAKKNVAKK